MIAPVFLVGFSGHRPEEGTPGRTESDLEGSAPGLEELFEKLRSKAGVVGGEIQLVSSLAAGADIIACETARKLNIPIHFVLSKPEAEFLETFVNQDPAKDFSDWIPRALDLLATVRPDSERDAIEVDPRHSLRVGAVSKQSPDCYIEANNWILEVADILVTLSNGEESKSAAGTTSTIKQAEFLGLPTVNLVPGVDSGMEMPAIPEQFAEPNCATLDPFRAIKGILPPEHEEGNSMAFSSLEEMLRGTAKRSMSWFRRAPGLTIVCFAIATILAALAASFYYSFKEGLLELQKEELYWVFAIAALVEFVLVLFGWLFEFLLHRDAVQDKWSKWRIAREVMLSLEGSNGFLDPLEPGIRHQLPSWRRFALSAALQLRKEEPVPLEPSEEEVEEWRRKYLKDRVQVQERRYRAKADEAKRIAHLFRSLTFWSGLVALLILLFASIVNFHEASVLKEGGNSFLDETGCPLWLLGFMLLFLPILMPLLASLGAFGAVLNYRRRAAHYRDMEEVLASTARRLATFSTLPDITRCVRRTEEVLLDDLIERYLKNYA